jgi:endonuclease III
LPREYLSASLLLTANITLRYIGSALVRSGEPPSHFELPDGAHTLKKPKVPVDKILKGLQEEYPDVRCALDHRDPLQLMVSTILSAQCTDARVNLVTPSLFAKYPTAAHYANATLPDLEKLIHSTGFFRNKAKSIKAAGQRLVTEFKGNVPQTMEELLTLPGVARKTANVVLGTAYGIAIGIVVDTHVFRLSHRLGLTRAKTPEKVEEDLMKIIPQKEWIQFSHRLIHHGRKVCSARNPQCDRCSLNAVCPKIGVAK